MAARGDINNQDVEPFLFEGWLKLDFSQCLDKIGEFTKLKSGDYFEQGEFPVIDQGEKDISGFVNDRNLLYKGDLPIIIFGDHTRNIKYVTNFFAVGADGTKILKPNKAFNPKFFFYYLKALTIPSLGYSRHYKILNNIELPLPPLPTQHRIVSKLDTLFGHLDALKTRLDRIPQLLKAFRQSVLTQAVTGKLTPDHTKWHETDLINLLIKGGIFDGPFGSDLKTVDYTETGVRVVRLENIEHLNFIHEKETFVSEEKYESLKRHSVGEGDIIFSSFITEEIRACILPKLNTKAIAKADCFCIRPNVELIDKKFLLFYLVSLKAYNRLILNIHGATRPRINTTQLKTLKVSLPPLKEQQEIVRRVESLFAKADRIEAQYQSLKAKIEQLPQALLAKAFRGELVEQLPGDGDARELLEEIRLKTQETRHKKTEMKRSGTGKKNTGRILLRQPADQDDTELKQVAEPKVKYGKNE